VAGLWQVGLPQSDMDKVFDSAEEFIRVWERADGIAHGTPITGGSPVAHCEARTVDADETCHPAAKIAPAADQNNADLTLTQEPAGPYGLGTTPVTLNVGSALSRDTASRTADVTLGGKLHARSNRH